MENHQSGLRRSRPKLTLPSQYAWIILTSGFIACSGGTNFVSGAAGGKSGTGVGGSSNGGTVGSGGTVDIDAGVSTGGISATGGDTSAGGSTGYGSLACADLQTAYAGELAIAKTCSTSGENTCVQTVLDAPVCSCSVFVSSTRTGALTNLEQIRGVWNNKKCAAGIACPAIACVVPTSANCVGASSATKSGNCTANTN